MRRQTKKPGPLNLYGGASNRLIQQLLTKRQSAKEAIERPWSRSILKEFIETRTTREPDQYSDSLWKVAHSTCVVPNKYTKLIDFIGLIAMIPWNSTRSKFRHSCTDARRALWWEPRSVCELLVKLHTPSRLSILPRYWKGPSTFWIILGVVDWTSSMTLHR